MKQIYAVDVHAALFAIKQQSHLYDPRIYPAIRGEVGNAGIAALCHRL